MNPSQREAWIRSVEAARRVLAEREGVEPRDRHAAAEGGCGVIGLAATVPIAGRHLERALVQMRNRGNGKGGGLAMVGLEPERFGVDRATLRRDHLLAIAYLEPERRAEIERDFIRPRYEIDQIHEVARIEDYRALPGLEVEPPRVVCYFVRPRADRLAAFAAEARLPADDEPEALTDEYVYQQTYALNRRYYGDGAYQAFVLSHGRDLLILKAVAHAEDVLRYYRLGDLSAHVWIGHHRYPTKGRVWHPGGAHPFLGMHEALVHNGDFANYAAVSAYLAQQGIHPLFQTDTEVAALVYDLHQRVYGYPIEYLIESLAPTTERDFALLPVDRQPIYQRIQRAHLHGSPDGPWFFILAQSAGRPGDPPLHRLLGITDTSMLRPQVFALQEGAESIGLCASEQQGIDAVLGSLSAEDPRFWSRADRYWKARGGSHTDGGAFRFDVAPDDGGRMRLTCRDKFGRRVGTGVGETDGSPEPIAPRPADVSLPTMAVFSSRTNGHQKPPRIASATALLGATVTLERDRPEVEEDWQAAARCLANGSEADLERWLAGQVALAGEGGDRRRAVLDRLTRLMDRRYPTGRLRRSRLLSALDRALEGWARGVEAAPCKEFQTLASSPPAAPGDVDQSLVLRASAYGPEDLAPVIKAAHAAGWRRFLIHDCRGHRFIGCGLGPASHGTRLDVYGSSGDYLASGIDGAEIHVHGSGQDQLGQILKSGRLVEHGDVGQTFLYGAKGGEVYVQGDAAGRPLINAVGRPRVVINGTCLDYLAESFMAGDPLDGGGFVILNGLRFDAGGEPVALDTPYPGGNLFSLASGGAVYLRDPRARVTEAQLNGGVFAPLGEADWRLIRPYLEANAAHFGISVDRLLTVDGQRLLPERVYRKVQPAEHKALQAEEAWVTRGGGQA